MTVRAVINAVSTHRFLYKPKSTGLIAILDFLHLLNF